MTVKELINALLDFPMDSKVDVLVNFGNEFLKEINISEGEEISDWFPISEIEETNFSSGRKDISIKIERY